MIGFFKICKKIPFKACLPAGKLFKKKTLKIMTTISMNYILTQHFAIFSTDNTFFINFATYSRTSSRTYFSVRNISKIYRIIEFCGI